MIEEGWDTPTTEGQGEGGGRERAVVTHSSGTLLFPPQSSTCSQFEFPNRANGMPWGE